MMNETTLALLSSISEDEKAAKQKYYDGVLLLNKEYYDATTKCYSVISKFYDLADDMYKITNKLISNKSEYQYISDKGSLQHDGFHIDATDKWHEPTFIIIPYEHILEYIKNQDEIYEE